MADYKFLASAGETYVLSTIAAMLSPRGREQGRDEDALKLSQAAEEASAADDCRLSAYGAQSVLQSSPETEISAKPRPWHGLP